MSTSRAWLDGRFVQAARAVLPLDDPAVTHGAGLFETLRVWRGRPLWARAHRARLADAARRLGIRGRIPAFEPILVELARRNDIASGAARVTLTGGGRLFATVRRWQPPPARVYERGASLALARFTRDPRAPLGGFKTLSYWENVLARDAARTAGHIDALVCAPDGRVLEGAVSNVFGVERGRLITPAVTRGVLPGIARGWVLETAHRAGLASVECKLGWDRLVGADEVFVTNALVGIVPVRRVGSRRFAAPGPVTHALLVAYRAELAALPR